MIYLTNANVSKMKTGENGSLRSNLTVWHGFPSLIHRDVIKYMMTRQLVFYSGVIPSY